MIVPIRRACRRLPVRLVIVIYLATVGGAVSWAQAPRRPLARLLGPQGLLTLLEVQTTRLSGVSDFLVVPTPHSGMLQSAEVMRYTLNFLQHGCFVSADQRRPIPAVTQSPKDSHPLTSGTAREL